MGAAYDAGTGKFTAPRDGVYYFSWNVLKKSRNYHHIDLMVNGVRSFISWQPGTQTFETLTGALFVQLRKGQEVWLRARQAGRELHGDIHASFSGFMF